MPNYHQAQIALIKLEHKQSSLPNALNHMADEFIEVFDVEGFISDYGLNEVNQLLERKK